MNNAVKVAAAAVAMLVSVVVLASGAREFKVMSYNVHHCEGADRKIDVARIADVIAKEAPDYVGVQELDCRAAKRFSIATTNDGLKIFRKGFIILFH